MSKAVIEDLRRPPPPKEDAAALSLRTGFPIIEDPAGRARPEVVKLIPESLARRLLALPIEVQDGGLLVAFADPLNLVNIDDLSYAANCKVMPAIATPEKIVAGIEKHYGELDPVAELIQGIEVNHLEIVDHDAENGEKPMQTSAVEPPIAKLVNRIILEAVRQRASDIHIDPGEHLTKVRFRVDGLLREIMSPPKKVHGSVCTRVKVLAALDIAEHRIPQDGRVRLIARQGTVVDLRVNIVPTIYGEKINMRLLEHGTTRLGIGALGMDPGLAAAFMTLIRRPSGLVVMVGPTGSGKTTALYSALSEINDGTQHVITVEDPVEYRLENVNQIQVNVKAGLTFALGLRSILRQDPNVILVGEVRDKETAEIAFEAATTGHQVLTTIHSTDAAHAVARLLSLGVNPFIAASALSGIVSVRLVRRLCAKCRALTSLPAETSRLLGNAAPREAFKAVGCQECRQTGYNGRTGLYELVPATDELRRLICSGAGVDEFQSALTRTGIATLWETGLAKAREGVTTIDEVVRVTRR